MGLGDQPPKALKKNPLGISLLGGLFLPDMNEGFVPGLFMNSANWRLVTLVQQGPVSIDLIQEYRIFVLEMEPCRFHRCQGRGDGAIVTA